MSKVLNGNNTVQPFLDVVDIFHHYSGIRQLTDVVMVCDIYTNEFHIIDRLVSVT